MRLMYSATVLRRAPGRAPESESAAETSTEIGEITSQSSWCEAMALITTSGSPYFFAHLGADLGVGALPLVIDRLADIVQQPRAAGQLLVQAQLGGEHPGEVGDLLAVLQHVLGVGGAVLQPAEQLDDLRVHALDSEFLQRLLPGALHLLFEPPPVAARQILDPARVDVAVLDQGLEDPARDLALDRVVTRQRDRSGLLVEQQLDPGDVLEGADVLAFLADDAALEVAALGQFEMADRPLGAEIGGASLDGQGDDLDRLRLGRALGLVLDLLDMAADSSRVCAFRLASNCRRASSRVIPETAPAGRSAPRRSAGTPGAAVPVPIPARPAGS